MRQLACCFSLLACALVAAAQPASAKVRGDAHTAVAQQSAAVRGRRIFRFHGPVTHVAVYWRGQHAARVHVALSRNGRTFSRFHRVTIDELGAERRNGTTYGNLIVAPRVRAILVRADRRMKRLTVLGLTDRGTPAPRPTTPAVRSAAATAQPTVIPRSGWGADESLRFDSGGKEIWPPAFYPVQKLIVHHTDTQNNDPNPAATIRSIYYYHAVTSTRAGTRRTPGTRRSTRRVRPARMRTATVSPPRMRRVTTRAQSALRCSARSRTRTQRRRRATRSSTCSPGRRQRTASTRRDRRSTRTRSAERRPRSRTSQAIAT
jgi:hypothetical protein